MVHRRFPVTSSLPSNETKPAGKIAQNWERVALHMIHVVYLVGQRPDKAELRLIRARWLAAGGEGRGLGLITPWTST